MATRKYGHEAQTPAAKRAKEEIERPRRGRLPKREQVDPNHVAKKIQVTKLIQVLEDVAINGTKITKERLKAIEILLNKSVPSLKQIDMTAMTQGNVTIEFVSNVKRYLDQD